MDKILRSFVSCLIWVCVGLLTFFVTIPIVLYTFFFWWLDSSRRLQHRIAIFWGWCILHLNPFWKISVDGLEHFSKKGTFVAVSNHRSQADIVLLYSLGRQFKWLAKESLFRIPFFGWTMKACGYIPLERGHHGSIRESFDESLKWLKRGMTVIVFPEGTRGTEEYPGEFKNGAFKLALKAKCPVLPIVIHGSEKMLGRGSWIFGGSARIEIHVLPPVEVQPYLPDHFEKLKEKVRGVMEAKM